MTISFPCTNCGKRFSVPDNMVGMQAKCGCGVSVTIPSESAPQQIAQQPVMQQQVMQQPATMNPYQATAMMAARGPALGKAYRASAAFAVAAGVLACLSAWPLFGELKTFFEFLPNISLTRWQAWVMILRMLAAVTLVVAGVFVLCRQEWALIMGAVAGYVLLGIVFIVTLVTVIRVTFMGLPLGLLGLQGYVAIVPMSIKYLGPPAAMVFAFHVNLADTD